MPTPEGGDAVADAVAAVVGALGGAPRVGVGIAGLIDAGGTVRVSPNLPGLVDAPLRDALERRLPGVSVVVENDVNSAAWAEATVGAARGFDDVVTVALGTGVGGGFVVRGRLERGAHGFGAEVGHMIVDRDGIECPCGRRGCWERYASGRGLGRLGREAKPARVVELAGGDIDAVQGEHVTAAAVEGDAEALAVMREFGWWVALGLGNLATLLDPDVIVLGGGLVEAGELLLGPVRDAFPSLVMSASHRPPVPILAAELGERAGAIGAALLAVES